jgi:WD40 repeat protein
MSDNLLFRASLEWSGSSDRPARALTGHTNYVTSVAFSPDGTLLATPGDKTTRLWT